MGHHSRPRGSTLLFVSCGSTSGAEYDGGNRQPAQGQGAGEKFGPIARMPTNADAHSTTVTSTAAMPGR